MSGVNRLSLKCKSCSGTMELDSEKEILNCPYCGSKDLLIESDVVKIKKIKYQTFKDIELGKEDFNFRLEKYRLGEERKRELLKMILPIFLFVLPFLLIFIFAGSVKYQSDKEEQLLQEKTNRIVALVKEEKFDEAFMLTGEIIYTADWSSDIEKKWNDKRSKLYDYVIEEEKKVNGKSKHKNPEKNFIENLFD